MRHSLYKYFTERKWAEAFLDGAVLFRSLAYFRDYEDQNVRSDRNEGTAIFRPQDGLVIHNQTQGKTFRWADSAFEAKANQEEILVYCASRTLSHELQSRFKAGLQCSSMDRHAWAGWVDEETKHRLWAARRLLKSAWDSDQESPEQYPMDTSWALAEIEQSVAKKKPDKPTKTSLRKWLNPRTLAELVPEAQISAVWEEYNSGTFKNAIKLAAEINYKNTKKSWKLFKTIIRAIEATYLARFLGHEFLSKPKVNILHTGLDQIAKTAGLEGQTQAGFVEFLDDLCPCGLKSHKGAVRKLSKRSARFEDAPPLVET